MDTEMMGILMKTLLTGAAIVIGIIIIWRIILRLIARGAASQGAVGDITNIFIWIVRHLWKIILIGGGLAIFLTAFN